MWDVTRADWGAGPHRAAAISTPVAGLVLHHSVTPAWRGAAAARNLRQIALGRGMVDISYSGLADTGGVSIEGRGWGRQGAHTRGHNTSKHAVCAVGNFDTAPMPQAMVNGIARICRDHRRYGPSRITHGHRDLGSTACPGRHAYSRIGAINAAASGTPSPPPSPGGFLMSLSDDQELWVWRWLRGLQHKSSSPEWLAGMDDRVKRIEADLREVKASQPGKPLLVRTKTDETIWLLLPEGRRRVDSGDEYALLRYLGHAQASEDGTPHVLADEQVAAYPVLDERS